MWAFGIDKDRLIFIDETGCNLHLRRRRGRNKKGIRAVIVQPASKGINISVFAAFSPVSGIVKYICNVGAMKAEEDYEPFIADSLKEPRFLAHSHFLIQDNARIHRNKPLEEILASQPLRHEVKFLPPYSPQLNSIEIVFSVWKSHICRCKMKTRNTAPRLTSLIEETSNCITPEMASNLHSHCVKPYVLCSLCSWVACVICKKPPNLNASVPNLNTRILKLTTKKCIYPFVNGVA